MRQEKAVDREERASWRERERKRCTTSETEGEKEDRQGDDGRGNRKEARSIKIEKWAR